MDRGKHLWCVFNPFISVPPPTLLYNASFSKRSGCQNAQSMVLATSDLPSVFKSTITKARVVADNISGWVFEWGRMTTLFFFLNKLSSATNQLVHIAHSNFFLSFQY